MRNSGSLETRERNLAEQWLLLLRKKSKISWLACDNEGLCESVLMISNLGNRVRC